MKKLLLLAVVLFSSAILFSSCGSASTPSAVIEKAVASAIDSDWDGYLKYVNISDEQKGQYKEMAAMKGDQAFPYSSFKIVSEEISEDGQTAKVKIEYTKKEGGTKNDTEKLVLVEGKWLIAQ